MHIRVPFSGFWYACLLSVGLSLGKAGVKFVLAGDSEFYDKNKIINTIISIGIGVIFGAALIIMVVISLKETINENKSVHGKESA